VGPHFLSRRSGKIVNISSSRAVRGGGDTVIYSLAKSAVIGFTRTQALEWAPYNVQINAIAPGSSRAPETYGKGSTTQADATGKSVPSVRYGRPRAVGLLALYLVSSASDYMNGQTLFLDGGFNS
jgi:NAD(P)-dependent dehydrogenase (short-subunit alcohol dehydrogenase family)